MLADNDILQSQHVSCQGNSIPASHAMPCPPDASSTRYTAAVWTRGRTPRIAVTDATTPTRECLCVVRVNNAQVLPNWACVVRTMPGSRRCVWSVRRPEEMEEEGLSGVPPGVHGKQELAFVPLKKSHSTEPFPRLCAHTSTGHSQLHNHACG